MKDYAQFEVVKEHEPPQNQGILKTRSSASPALAHRRNARICCAVSRLSARIRAASSCSPPTTTASVRTITAIYKDRWQIELFFKVLKQNLKIKTFVGTSANVVKTQIWTTLLSMLLLRYLQSSSRFGWGLANLVELLCINLFTHRDLMAWLDEPFAMSTPPNQQDSPKALWAFV